MPPRRATVSAMRRPATAVMLATATGSVVPTPSDVDRSTSSRDGTSERLGTMKTSLYVRSNGGGVSVRKRMAVTRGPDQATGEAVGPPPARYRAERAQRTGRVGPRLGWLVRHHVAGPGVGGAPAGRRAHGDRR